MSRVIKIVVGGLVVLVALVLLAAGLLLLLVDPADYRDQITQAIEDQTGRSAHIEGEISLSLFPTLGLEVGGMSLGNPPGFDALSFVAVDKVAIGARVWPLLSRRLEVSTLRLEGLRILLVKMADGRTNWDGLVERQDPVELPVASPAEESRSDFKVARIDGIEARDVFLRYEDRGEGQVVEAGIPRLSVGALQIGQSFPVEAEATLALGNGRTRLSARLTATLSWPAEAAPFEVANLLLRVDAAGEDVPGGRQAVQLTVPRLVADMAQQVLDLPRLVVEAAGMRAVVQLEGRSLAEAPVFTGQVEVAEFSPRELLKQLGETAPETLDPAVLTRMKFVSGVRGAAGEWTLEGLRLQLDDSQVEGRLAFAPGPEVIRIQGALSLDRIDVDRYLGPEKAPEDVAPPDDGPLAFEWLRQFDVDLRFAAADVVVTGLRLSGVDARAVAKGGHLVLQPVSASLYEGQARGRAVLDARQSPATFRLQPHVSGLQMQPFIADLAGFDRLAGVARLEADLATAATSTGALLSGLNGTLGFDINDGRFVGVNLWYEIQRAYALAKGRPAPQKSSPDTEFRQLKGTAVIRDGRLVNEDLVGGLPFLALAGRGEIDLAQGALDYRLTATVVREAVDEVTGERSELAGLRIPLRLSGALASPAVTVDLAELLKERAVEELKERARDPLRKLRDRIRPNG